MTWFWVMTLQYSNSCGTTFQTIEGTIDAEQAARLQTRAAAFRHALAASREFVSLPEGQQAVVLFFSLEPDALGFAESAL